MAELHVGTIAELLGVSVDTARRLVDSGRIPSERSDGGRRAVRSDDLAAYIADKAEAPDVPPIVGQSARNRFPGIVTRVVKDKVMAQVEIHAGPHRVVSLMSREACDELGLAPGVIAIASIKATNVVVEIPSS